MTMTQRLSVNEEMTIYHALEQKNQLLDALSTCEILELDLLQVGDIDTAGVQLLLMLKKEAQRTHKQVAIVAHSQPVHAVIEFCNLGAELGDPLLIQAAAAA